MIRNRIKCRYVLYSICGEVWNAARELCHQTENKTLTLLLAYTSRLSDRIKSHFHHHQHQHHPQTQAIRTAHSCECMRVVCCLYTRFGLYANAHIRDRYVPLCVSLCLSLSSCVSVRVYIFCMLRVCVWTCWSVALRIVYFCVSCCCSATGNRQHYNGNNNSKPCKSTAVRIHIYSLAYIPCHTMLCYAIRYLCMLSVVRSFA